MRLLIIGDFHGKFPVKLMRRIKKERFDLIISPGDFCGSKKLGELFFKYAYETDKELWEFIGKRKVNKLEKESFEAGINILRKLNDFGKPVIIVRGNWDPQGWYEVGYPMVRNPYIKRFKRHLDKMKNIRMIDFKSLKLKNINFIGYPRSTYPGVFNKHVEKKMKKKHGKDADKILNRLEKDNKKLFELFKKKFKRRSIFVSHNCPYNTKLDKIKKGEQKGKHYGGWLIKKLILAFRPRLVICGHMHENPGKEIVGKSLVVNPGAAMDGRAAIIDYPEDKKKKIKVRFIK
jgi:Icc-related predicted phosphoesterase